MPRKTDRAPTPTSAARSAVALAALTLVAGCDAHATRVATAFPPGESAAPWVLAEPVWQGGIAEAEPALGDDAGFWREAGATDVWLAVYRDPAQSEKRMIARAFAFASPDVARSAFTERRGASDPRFDAGDEGCWTDDGVLFRWRRLVIEIFGTHPEWAAEQAALLAAYVQKRMPSGAPDNPR